MLTIYQFLVMLSVLIPVYQFEVFPLVASLVAQCRQLDLTFEIILFDDGSSASIKKANHQILQFAEVLYEELPQNIGRSAIRNRLGERAIYPYLLFMDGDSKVVRTDYIANYMRHCQPNHILYGGRIYQHHKPTQQPLVLHWKSGQAKEVIAATDRALAPYTSFMTNNFLIPKAIFKSIPFDEKIRWYGHEDTLFGEALAKHQITIHHIDNPLMHIGLENAAEVLLKTQQAIENLILINDYYSLQTKLSKTGDQIIQIGVGRMVNTFLRWISPVMKQHLLQSNDPLLWVLDLYKLGMYLKLKHRPNLNPGRTARNG